MTTATFDPVAYKRTTREQWQAAAEPWYRWGPTLEEWLGEATELMLDMAHVGPGGRVLDVAAGAGGQTLAAARRVGANGSVLATDISENILEFAEHWAQRAGVTNVATRVMDGEQLDVGEGFFDAVICRLGFMYFPEQQAAFAGMRRALKPGGRGVLNAGAQRVLLDPGLDRSPPSCASGPASGAAGTVQLRRAGRDRSRVRACRVHGHPGSPRARTGADALRSGVRAVRARIVRRASPDARRSQRARARGGMERDRAGALAVRDPGWVRRTLRADRQHRHRTVDGPDDADR